MIYERSTKGPRRRSFLLISLLILTTSLTFKTFKKVNLQDITIYGSELFTNEDIVDNSSLRFPTPLIFINTKFTESELKKRKGRAEFQRGIIYKKNNKNYVKTVGEQGSGILSSMTRANCLIYLPVEQGKVKLNDKVQILMFKEYI